MDTDIELDLAEAMTMQQRLKKRTQMRILAPRLAMARKRNAKRMASKDKLEARAEKKAKNMLIQKIAKKPKSEMSYSERGRVEDRLAKMKTQVKTIAKKLFKDVKKAEVDRLRAMKNPDQSSEDK
jgi:hypothetical protein